MLNKLKSIFVADHNNPIELEGVETWIVTWVSRPNDFILHDAIAGQAFTSKEDAQVFVKSLEKAFTLVKNLSDKKTIKLTKQ